MKKVLLVATVQSHIAQFHIPLIKMLKEKKYEVHVAARDNLKEKNGLKIEGADEIYDICFSRSPFKLNNLKAYKQLRKIVKENKYDIVHCNTPMGSVIARLVCKKYRKTGMKVISRSLDLSPEETRDKCQEIGRMFEMMAQKSKR